MNKLAQNLILALIVSMCFMSSHVNAQRCAVLEFNAGVGISQNDVDGISAIFITYFHPAGYTMVERTQIDKIIDEQGFQRSKMTQSQMVRLGEILNVSKIVVGDINILQGQYNVDVRVINVETGTISATEGATFASSSYRSSMQSVAQKLAGKIAISPGSVVPEISVSKQRTTVEVLYGYLKIFPKEIGNFSSEPTNVISQINAQAQYGYNNWRIPTNEELSLLRSNNYLGGGEYMTKESKHGIVLLVSDGKDYATMQAEEQAEIKRKERLEAQGYVDLGLPSGTMWKDKNEKDGSGYNTNLYTFKEAWSKFGNRLPTREQLSELFEYCKWHWDYDRIGYNVVGPNGKSIFFPALGRYDEDHGYSLTSGNYWTSSQSNHGGRYFLYFYKGWESINDKYDSSFQGSVRLVYKK